MLAHDLYLARHGQTEWNAVQRMQGRLNSPLTARGMRDAADLRAIFAAVDLEGAALFCSPQGRALQTAGLALGGCSAPIRTDDRLMEIDVGAWSGLMRDEIIAVRPDLFSDDPSGRHAWYDAAPGGEGFAGLQSRCRSFVGELSGPTVVITHGITLRMLMSLALGGDASQFGALPGVRQGVVYHVARGAYQTIEAP